MRRVTIILVALLLVLVSAAPAAAAKPWLAYEGSWDELTPAVGDCGDFTISFRTVGQDSETYYFDNAGNVVKTIYKNRGTDALINDVTGKVIDGSYGFGCHVTIVTLDPLVYYRDCQGTFWNITEPGFGTIFHQAGHSEEFVEGPPGAPGEVLKDVGSARFPFDEVCRALAD